MLSAGITVSHLIKVLKYIAAKVQIYIHTQMHECVCVYTYIYMYMFVISVVSRLIIFLSLIKFYFFRIIEVEALKVLQIKFNPIP